MTVQPDVFDLRPTPDGLIPKDGYKRPLIMPPYGDELVPYTRCSTFASTLKDGEGLLKWACAMTLLGAAQSDVIVNAARSMTWDENRSKVLELVDNAKVLAGADDAAIIGTTLHEWTEKIDRGFSVPGNLPSATLADLDAYVRATAMLKPVAVERFVVVDELRVAGTFDRIVEVQPDPAIPEALHGRRVIADLKTGSVEHAVNGFAVQLACYAHGVYYDPDTYERTPTGADLEVGILIHLPQGTGTCTLHAINLEEGWRAAWLASAVRNWRTRAKPSNSRFTSSVIRELATVSA